MDASKKIFVVTGILVFEFEFFIGGYGAVPNTGPFLRKHVLEISCIPVVPSCLNKYISAHLMVFSRKCEC